MAKSVIRKQLLTHRKRLDEKKSQEMSLHIQQNLIAAEVFIKSKNVALYSPVNNEVATVELFSAALSAGKRVCYPRVAGESLEFIEVDSLAALTSGAFGVLEPKHGEVVTEKEIDLIVVPGVAFDAKGFRLGYGKGFYDRSLHKMPSSVVRVGLSYGFQLCDDLPAEAHDQSLDYVTTETQIIPCYKVVTGSP